MPLPGSPLIRTGSPSCARRAISVAHGFHRAALGDNRSGLAVRVHQHVERLGLLIEIPDLGVGASQIGGQAGQHQRAQRGALAQRAGKASRRVAQQPHGGQRHDVGGDRVAGDQGHLAEGRARAHAAQRQVHAVLAGQPHLDQALEDRPERHAWLATAHEHVAGGGGDLDAFTLKKCHDFGGERDGRRAEVLVRHDLLLPG